MTYPKSKVVEACQEVLGYKDFGALYFVARISLERLADIAARQCFVGNNDSPVLREALVVLNLGGSWV